MPLYQDALISHEPLYSLCLPLRFCKESALLYHSQGGAAVVPVPGGL